jgi:hypothetical protein
MLAWNRDVVDPVPAVRFHSSMSEDVRWSVDRLMLSWMTGRNMIVRVPFEVLLLIGTGLGRELVRELVRRRGEIVLARFNIFL